MVSTARPCFPLCLRVLLYALPVCAHTLLIQGSEVHCQSARKLKKSTAVFQFFFSVTTVTPGGKRTNFFDLRVFFYKIRKYVSCEFDYIVDTQVCKVRNMSRLSHFY